MTQSIDWHCDRCTFMLFYPNSRTLSIHLSPRRGEQGGVERVLDKWIFPAKQAPHHSVASLLSWRGFHSGYRLRRLGSDVPIFSCEAGFFPADRQVFFFRERDGRRQAVEVAMSVTAKVYFRPPPTSPPPFLMRKRQKHLSPWSFFMEIHG